MGRYVHLLIMLAAAGVICGYAQSAIAQSNTIFNVAGPADWNVGGNWNPAFVPDAQFNENSVIEANRSAFVSTTVPNPGGITINSGTLDVRAGGSLTAAPGTLMTGNLTVGTDTGTATLLVKRGGSLGAQQLATGGATSTQIVLGESDGSGTAAFSIAGGTLNRTTRIVGNNVSFSSSNTLSFGASSTLVPVITGASHSTINVTGTTVLGGTVRPEFSGYTPVLGNAWNLVNGSQLIGDFELDVAHLPLTPRGTGYSLTRTPTTSTLRYSNLLVLTVDRATGATRIENVVGSPISFEGYTVFAPNGNLAGNWTSLQDQSIAGWEEADNSNNDRITEFKRMAPTSLNVGASLNMGSPYAPEIPSAFGEQTEESLEFRYAIPGQGTTTGIVEFTGRRNNVVLTIDPATGETAIQNESPFFNVAIDAYTITSSSGKLNLAANGWESLDSQSLGAWEVADNVDAFRITEFSPSGSSSLPGGGTVLNLGNAIQVGGGAPPLSDLGFQFKLSTGQIMEGIIAYGPVPTSSPTVGDADNDGDVDGRDFLIWQRTFGTTVPAGTGADWNNSGTVNGADLPLWQSNYGASLSAIATTQAVPESNSLLFVGIIAGIVLAKSRGRRRRDR
jgi:hypothetical protein